VKDITLDKPSLAYKAEYSGEDCLRGLKSPVEVLDPWYTATVLR